MSKERIVEIVKNSVGGESLAGVSKKDFALIIDTAFDAIADDLSEGHAVQYPGFGTFAVKERAERPGRKAQTGVRAITVKRASKPVGIYYRPSGSSFRL